jgi:hypothetical protein
MDDAITQNLFESVRHAVERVCQHAQEDLKQIITEGDLQSWIFVELVKDHSILASGVHVHSQINYLKEDSSLGHLPDIVLLPSSAYSVDSSGELHDRKGYTVRGSSIAIEIKLLRSHRRDGFVSSVEEDLAKLKRIRDQHYAHDEFHRFFAASVVLCRQHLSDDDITQLQDYAIGSEIALWIYNSPNLNS